MTREQIISMLCELVWQSDLDSPTKYEAYGYLGAGDYPSRKMLGAMKADLARQRTV